MDRKIITISKKSISLILALIMAFSAMSILAGPFKLTAYAGSDNKDSGKNSGNLGFNVPEVIYLTPGGSSFALVSDQTMSVSGGNVTITVNNTSKAISSGGNVNFYYGNADDVTIKVSGASSVTLGGTSINASTGKTIALSSGIANTTVTAGSMSSAASGYLKWTADYYDKADGKNKQAIAYTYVYSPYIHSVAATSTNACRKYSASAVKYCFWSASVTSVIAGIHGLSQNAGSGSELTFYCDGTNTCGSTSNSNVAVVYEGEYMPNGNYVLGNSYAPIRYSHTANSTGNVKDPGAPGFYNTSSGVKSYKVSYRKNSYGSDQYATSGVGNIYVDTSRHTNFSQIPNFIVRTDFHGAHNWNKEIVITNTYATAVWTNTGTPTTTGTNKGSTSYIKPATSGNADSQHPVWQQDINLSSLSTSGVSSLVISSAVNAQIKDNGGDFAIAGVAGIEVTGTNKANLRAAVKNATNIFAKVGVNGVDGNGKLTSCYFDYSTAGYKWQAFADAYKAAVDNLTKVDASCSADTLATNLNNAINNLCTKITLNANGGTITGDTVLYYDIGSSNTVSTSFSYTPNPTISRSGYTLLGWAKTSTGTPSASVSLGYNNTLYAIWRANGYKVAYSGNGNTGGSTAGQDHVFNVSKALTQNGFTKTGYHFVGWATTSGGSVAYTDKQSVQNLTTVADSTVTLYAVWEKNTYTVVYNGNTNTGGSTASTSHTYDVNGNLRSNGFTKVGHTFAGWATTAGGSVAYANGASVKNLTTTNGGTVNLYAKWTPNPYALGINTNNGYGQNNLMYFKNGDASFVNNTNSTFTASGTYEADGDVAISANVSGNGGEKTAMFDNMVAYFEEGHRYKLTFTSTNSFTDFFAYKEGSNMNIRTGRLSGSAVPNGSLYDHTVYFTIGTKQTGDNDGDGRNLQNQPSGTLTAYYNFRISMKGGYNGSVSITNVKIVEMENEVYASNHTDHVDNYITQRYGTTRIINDPLRTGYTFNGWSLTSSTGGSANGSMSGNVYSFGSTSAAGPDTLTANWTANKYSLTFNSNGTTSLDCNGNSSVNGNATYTREVTFDGTYGTLPTPVWSGFVFVGWFKGTNASTYNVEDGTGSGTQVNASDIYRVAGNETIYAHWRRVKITFNVNKPSDASNNVQTSLSSLNIIPNGIAKYNAKGWPTTTLTGWTLDGWYTSSGAKVLPTDTVAIGTGDITLTARWTKNTYTFVFHGNGNTGGSMTNQTFYYDTSATINANQFEKSHTISITYGNGTADASVTATSTFAGWATSAKGSVVYANGANINNLTSVNGATYDLYAKWNYYQYTLPKITRTGYQFAGWYYDSAKKNKAGNANDVISVSGNISLYANWSRNTYYIAFNANGGSGTMAKMTLRYSTASTLTQNSFTRLGYYFDSWNTKSDGTGTKYTNLQSVKNLTATQKKTINLYAIWKQLAATDKYAVYDFSTQANAIAISTSDVLYPGGTLKIGSSRSSGVNSNQATTTSSVSGNFNNTGFDARFANGALTTTNTSEKIIITPNGYSSEMVFYYEYSFTETSGYTQYISGKITVVPSNNTYYEETVFSVSDTVAQSLDIVEYAPGEEPNYNEGADWSTVTSTMTAGATTSLESSFNIYGYSDYYNNNSSEQFSNGTALKATVTQENTISKSVEYRFNGRGFELYSACGPETSALLVYVWKINGSSYNLVTNVVIDTYLSDANLVKGDCLRQVPVYHFQTNEDGNYLVQVHAAYLDTCSGAERDDITETLIENNVIEQLENAGLEINEDVFELLYVTDVVITETKNSEIGDDILGAKIGSPTLYGYIDGIRIYSPYSANRSKYYNEEMNAAFFSMKKYTFATDTYNYNSKIRDEFNGTSVSEKIIAPGKSTSFKLQGLSDGSHRIMISLRAINGTVTVEIGAASKKTYTIKSGTEMFYDITDCQSSEGIFVISVKGTSTGYLALGDIKVTSYEALSGINLVEMSEEDKLLSAQYLEALTDAPEVEIKEPTENTFLNPITYKPESYIGEVDEDGKPLNEDIIPDEPIEIDPPVPVVTTLIKIKNFLQTKIIDYKATITFRYEIENDAGKKVEWIVSGANKTVNKDGSCTIKNATNDFTVTVKTKDANGDEVTSLTETIKVKNGFFDKLIAFFKGLFGSLPNITQ